MNDGMEKRPFFSIIVPMYNVGLYAGECIESIINQTIEDYEAILVDDGSTDNTGDIIDDYVSKYKDKLRVIHSENRGLVGARQLGLSYAVGKYCIPLDGDDWLDKECLELFKISIEKTDAKVICCGIKKVFGDKIEYNSSKYKGLISGEDWQNLIGKNILSLNMNLCSKCIETELYRKKQNKINPQISMGEDGAVMYPLYVNVDKIYCLNECLYNYRQVESSMSKSKTKFIPWEHGTWRIKHLKEELKVLPNNEDVIIKYASHAWSNSAVSIMKRYGYHEGKNILEKCLNDPFCMEVLKGKSNILNRKEKLGKILLLYRLYLAIWIIASFR